MFDGRLLVLVAVASIVVPAGSAAAASETVPTPAGTFHATGEADVGEPHVGVEAQDFLCVGGGGLEEQCVTVAFPTADADVSAGVAVYEETNGCEGLQTQAQDCDDDADEESADRLLIAVDGSGELRQGLV